MQSLSFLTKHYSTLVIALAVFGIAFTALVLLKTALFYALARLAKKTKTRVDDVIISSLNWPSVVLCLLLSLYFVSFSIAIPDNLIAVAYKGLSILGIITVTFAIADLAAKLIFLFSGGSGSGYPMTSLTVNISSIVIFGIGILIILNSLGISITPILATLGVGGIAVALALQDTLSNLFSGFHIIASRQTKIGDYIKLSSGEEGYVTDINWRTTKIRMLSNNEILIPNSKLTQAIITNFNLPEKETAVLVNIGIHYNSDLVKAEKITVEVAKDVMGNTQGGVPGFTPFIRYHTFADSSIIFTVILRAKEFVDQYLVKHEFIKKLHDRYKQEGIVIPYPIRAINNTQESNG